MKKYQLLQQKEKDLDTMIDALDRVRAKYASGNQSTKGQLTPGILDHNGRTGSKVETAGSHAYRQ